MTVSRPSRRTLVKGAAWSMPVVAMSSPAMALTCSPTDTRPECNPVTPPTSRPGEACKFSGASCSGYKQAYRFVFCMTNTSKQDITVSFPLISFADGRTRKPSPSAVVVPGDGKEHCYYVLADDMGNSANGQGFLSWKYSWTDEYGRRHDVSGTSATGVNQLPPCPDCGTTYGVRGSAPAQVRSAEQAPATADAAVATEGPQQP